MTKVDNTKPVTKKVLIETLIEFWEQVAYPMIEKKADAIDVNQKIDQTRTELKAEIIENRRLIRDQEWNAPTKSEFTVSKNGSAV